MQGQELSDGAFATVQGALNRMSDEAIGLGLTVRVETDLEEFARLRRSVGDGGLYPSFDPAVSQLARDAFWLRVLDDDGELVAILAARVFRCADFMALLRSERVWFDRGLRLVSQRYNVLETRFDDDAWGGVIGHGGGLWVNPRVRGHGITTWLPIYLRALVVRMYQADWHTGLVFENMAARARRAYGYSEIELVIDGYFPVTGGDARVYLTRMSRAEIVTQLGADSFATRVAPLAPARVAG